MADNYTGTDWVTRTKLSTDLMAEMDEGIKKGVDAGEAAQTAADNAQSTADSAQSAASAAQSTADSATSKNTTQDSDIAALQTENANLKAQIAELEDEVSELNTNLENVPYTIFDTSTLDSCDLNDVGAGLYFCNQSANTYQNVPVANNGFLFACTRNTNIRQFFMPTTGSNIAIYSRFCNSGTWGNWGTFTAS